MRTDPIFNIICENFYVDLTSLAHSYLHISNYNDRFASHIQITLTEVIELYEKCND